MVAQFKFARAGEGWGIIALRYADGANLDEHLHRFRDAFAQLDAVDVKLSDVVKALFIIGSLPASWSAFQTTQTAAATTAHLTVTSVCAAIQTERDRRVLHQQSTTSLIDSPTALAAVQRAPTPQRRRDVTCAWCLNVTNALLL